MENVGLNQPATRARGSKIVKMKRGIGGRMDVMFVGFTRDMWMDDKSMSVRILKARLSIGMEGFGWEWIRTPFLLMSRV